MEKGKGMLSLPILGNVCFGRFGNVGVGVGGCWFENERELSVGNWERGRVGAVAADVGAGTGYGRSARGGHVMLHNVWEGREGGREEEYLPSVLHSQK